MVIFWAIILGLLSVVLIKAFQIYSDEMKLEAKLANIPTPKTRYPFSQFVDLLSDAPWDVLWKWSKELGPIFRWRFGTKTYIVVSDPEMFERIFNSNRPNYIKDQSVYKYFSALLGTGLITSEGEVWHKQRGLVAPVFRASILGEVADTSIAAANRLAKKLQVARGNKSVVEIGEEFRHLTLQVIGTSVLSMDPAESDRVFPDLYLPIADEANKRVYFPIRAYLPLPATFKFNQACRDLDAYINRIIAARFEELSPYCKEYVASEKEPQSVNGRQIDILDRIILSIFKEQGDSRLLPETARRLCFEIKTFLFAGHETSSMMMTWALWELITNPECMAKMREEARSLWGDLRMGPNGEVIEDKQPSFDEINSKLTYAVAVLRETLRKRSIVPVVTREALEDDTIKGFHIPKGAAVVTHLKAVHHRADLWPEPEKFMPERFIGNTKHLSYNFLGFIQGPRNCVGQHFALLEVKIVLSRLILLFDYTPAPGEKGQHHMMNIPVAPRDRLRVLVQ